MKTVQLLILLGLVYYCAGFGGGIVGPHRLFGDSPGLVPNGDHRKYPVLCPDEDACSDFCGELGFDFGECVGRDNRKCHCYSIYFDGPEPI